jgi:hypothetical protein
MDQILEQVSRARRRLWLELFLNRLTTSWFVGLSVALVALAIPKLVAISGLPANWSLWCITIGLGAGTIAALVWTLVDNKSTLDAAVELDSRFGLRERVASSLSLTPTDAATPAGQALLLDASRAIAKVEVGSRFGVELPRKRWLPLATTALAFAMLTMIDNRQAQSSVDPHAAEHAKVARENVSKKLGEKLVEKKKQAVEKGLKEAAGLFEQLEKETEKLLKNAEADQKKSLVKLNDLARQLEKRRSEIGSKEEIRKQLANLDKMNQGPAEKMAQAMKNGDWQKALEHLQKVKEDLKTGMLSEEQKKALEEQLKNLAEKLKEASEARDKSMDDLKKQIQQQQQQGDLARAGELQQKLDQMQAQQAQMSKMNQLAQQMSQAQQAMQQGDMSKASEAMDQMTEQMQALEQDMKEGEMLDAAMAEMQMAKEAMACQECSGEGCEACQGSSASMSQKQSDKPGSGIGKGTSWGNKGENDVDAKFRDSRVKQQTGAGPSIVAGEADGPNLRGQVATAIQTEMDTSGNTPADPQVIEQLPKSRREHAEEYFELMGEGR